MRSNCLWFALSKWINEGGYFIIRKSHYGWWPHFLWSQDMKIFEQFHPLEYQQKLRFPPFWFKGTIKTSSLPDLP